MKALETQLGVSCVYGAPTHKAAAVLRRKLDDSQAARVRTYHSLVYRMHAVYHCDITGRQVRRIVDTCTCGQADACQCPARFDPCNPKLPHTCRVREELTPERREYLGGHRELIIIDESSMLSHEQVADIRSYGVPVLLVGDHGQLPPVKADMNPWIANPDVTLTHIHRQGADSGILQAAHDVRNYGVMRRASYGNNDAARLPFTNPHIEKTLDNFQPGTDRLIITATNKRRAEVNRAWHGKGDVRTGDRVVALGGRVYDAFRAYMTGDTLRVTGGLLQVHNGMTGTVRAVIDNGGLTIDMAVELDDHPLATPTEPVFLLIGNVPRAQFGAEKDLPFDSPLRPRGSRLWDYAYALTAHKAQGSEFGQVIVIDDRPPSYVRWLYTSITRAKDAVLVIDYHR